jgi:hypothetical protein
VGVLTKTFAQIGHERLERVARILIGPPVEPLVDTTGVHAAIRPSSGTSGRIVFNLPLGSDRESGHSKGPILSERLCQ